MKTSPACPHGFVQFQGMAPNGNGRAWFIVSKAQIIGTCTNLGPRQKALEGFGLPSVADNPSGVWRGLGRDGTHETLVYAGIPTERLVGDHTISVPAQRGRTFVFYATAGLPLQDQYKVEYWEWVPADPGRPGFPMDHETRYGDRLWPTDSMSSTGS